MRRALIIIFLFGGLLEGAEKAPKVEETQKPKSFWLNVGAGLPQLASFEFSYRVFSKWQVGVSYGVIPGGSGVFSPTFSLPSQNVTLANNTFVTFEQPTVQSGLTSLCPFVRFFPGVTPFYLQLTVGMWRIANNFDSAILDINGNKIVDASYKGTITVTQFLPTISMGHVFGSQMFFFNVNMGVTIAATTQVSSAIETILPDSLGGTSGNQTQLDELNTKTNQGIQNGMAAFREEVKFLPSIHLTVGFMF